MNPTYFAEEQCCGKLAAVFRNARDAREAISRLVTDASLPRAQIDMIVPRERDVSDELQAEPTVIAHAAAKSNLVLGAGGAFSGAFIAGLLVIIDTGFAEPSPWLFFIATTLIGGVTGLMLGGLVTAQPDLYPPSRRTRKAAGRGDYTVIVRSTDPAQHESAKRVLRCQVLE